MKKVLMLSVIFLFFVGIVNAQGVRDDNSYFIYFDWTDGRPDLDPPGGEVFYDLDLGQLGMNAVRTNRGFNVYARNNSPDAETGARVVNHSAYPDWYSKPAYNWDVPDADASWANGTRYLISLDTFQEKWWLFYTDYPFPSNTKGTVNIYVPMSGTITDVEFNDNTVDIYLLEDGGDWKTYWWWGFDYVRLQDRTFMVHLDLDAKTGYMAPRQLLPENK